MGLFKKLGSLFRRKTIKVDARELEAIRRENAEASGHPLDAQTVDPLTEMPMTVFSTGIGKKNGKGYKPVSVAGNPVAQYELGVINKRYEESAWNEEHLRDD